MATQGIENRFRLPRIEGDVALFRDDQGRILLTGAPTLDFEGLVRGKGGLDASMRTQHVSADSGIAHALASMEAWEAAGQLPVAENGRALRGVLHTASLLHAHLRHFYIQLLPDYLPEATLLDYTGGHTALNRIRKAVSGRGKGHWTRHGFEHPFTLPEINLLWEHRAQAMEALGLLQRMMAVIGGKFPMAMSIVPGGVNLLLSESRILQLRRLLEILRLELTDTPMADGELLVKRHPVLAGLGEGGLSLLSAGSGEDESVLDGGLFPSGILLEGKLEPYSALSTESIDRAFYSISPTGEGGGRPVSDPDKPGAYSWVKAPRYQGLVLEAGPIARMAIAYLSGERLWDPKLVERVESLLRRPLARANTVGGRILARMGETGGLLSLIESQLDQLDPGQPSVSTEQGSGRFSGEGTGTLEAPAGTLSHRTVVDKGRIAYYDIVTPNTWNGSPQDQNGRSGALETALNRSNHDLDDPAQRRLLSRIVQSFAFSMRDAVH